MRVLLDVVVQEKVSKTLKVHQKGHKNVEKYFLCGIILEGEMLAGTWSTPLSQNEKQLASTQEEQEQECMAAPTQWQKSYTVANVDTLPYCSGKKVCCNCRCS